MIKFFNVNFKFLFRYTQIQWNELLQHNENVKTGWNLKSANRWIRTYPINWSSYIEKIQSVRKRNYSRNNWISQLVRNWRDNVVTKTLFVKFWKFVRQIWNLFVQNYSKLEILCVTQFFGLTQNCGMGSSRIGSSNLSSGPGIGPGPGGIGPSGIGIGSGITGIVQFPISSGILISGPSSLSLSSSSGIMGKSFHHPSGNSHQPSGNFQPSGRSSQGGNRLPLSPSPESPSPSPELLSSLPETEISNFEFENNIELWNVLKTSWTTKNFL